MADPDRDQAAPVAWPEDLLRRGGELGFFGFVALVERLAGAPVRVGGDGPLEAEPVRFRHDPAMTFSAGDLTSLRALPGAHPRLELMTSFLGLTGAVTPLPLYVAEELADDGVEDAQRGFLDLFHHRLLSLLYRAYVKYRLGAEVSTAATDAWTRRLLALAGVDSLTQRSALPSGAVLSLLPALVSARRSPAALEDALRLVLEAELQGGAQVRVVPFVGEWASLDPRDVCRLGLAGTRLGEDLVLGARVFDRAGKFRIELGPVGVETFRLLRAGGPLRETIDAVVALFVSDWLSYEVQITVDQTRQRLHLSAAAPGPRLGVDAWLGHHDPKTASIRLGDGSQPGRRTGKEATRP
jgi:type VI secretion system protein ImpH